MDSSKNQSDLSKVHELLELDYKLDASLPERWHPKLKEQIQSDAKRLDELLKVAQKAKWDETILGGEDVLESIRETRRMVGEKLQGKKPQPRKESSVDDAETSAQTSA